jgi:hypothetical protein
VAGTLTLSAVEQAAVLRHLEVQYNRLCGHPPASPHPDCVTLHRIMTRVGHDRTVGLTAMEGVTMLRHLRFQHRRLDDDMMALEERRLRGGHNGTLDAAHRALDADATILADVLRRLWDML